MDKLCIPMKNVEDVSDGYHSFKQLYEHRITLYIALCAMIYKFYQGKGFRQRCPVWKSRKHSDDSSYEGWFIMGINTEKGEQISYHLPDKYWDKTKFAKSLPCAPEFDGHTAEDVIERLSKM